MARTYFAIYRNTLSKAEEFLFAKGESLGSRSLKGGALVIIDQAYGNLIRLASNLILTRLLYPEAFGLMLIVNLIITAFGMMTDVGVRNAIIVKKDNLDADYIDTAWTMAVARGAILCLAGLLCAGPIATYYEQDQLFGLIVLTSLSPLIQGFVSPNILLDEKKVRLDRIVKWGIVSQTTGTVIVVVWVYLQPSVWTLAAGGPISAMLMAIFSFLLLPGHKPKFRWKKPVVLEILNLGKWIVLGTAISYFARQGDALIVSQYATTEQLGIFGIALTLAKLIDLIVEKLSWGLLFPVYSELRESGIDEFNTKLARIKIGVYVACAPAILTFAIFGRDLIAFLYDARYHEGGWMLELIASGAVFVATVGTIANIPMSFGDSYRHMWLQVFRFSILLACMLIGAEVAGFVGLVIGIPLAQAAFYPIARFFTHKYDVKGYLVDLVFVCFMLTTIAVSWSVRGTEIPL